MGCDRAWRTRRRRPGRLFERAAPLAQRRHRVGHVHQAEPAQHGIEGRVRHIQFLAIHGAGLDLGEPPFAGDLARKFDDAFRDVGRQHVTCGTDPFGGTDSRLTRAGGDVQDALALPNPGQVQHPAGHLAIPAIEDGIPAPPRRAVLVPLRSLRALVLRSVEGGLLFGHVRPPSGWTRGLLRVGARTAGADAGKALEPRGR